MDRCAAVRGHGDTAVLLPPDEYSNGYPVLGKLFGRRFDITYSTTGAAISPLTYGRILKHFDTISQWQFVQEGEKEYKLKVVMRSEDSNLDSIVDQLKEYIGKDAIVTIEKVSDIPVLASGKRKPCVNNWKK